MKEKVKGEGREENEKGEGRREEENERKNVLIGKCEYVEKTKRVFGYSRTD